MKRTTALFLSLVLFSSAAVAARQAEAASFKIEYEASLMGLPVGKLDVSSAIRPRSYEIQALGKLTGVAGLFASGKGGATAVGSLRNGSAANPIAGSAFQASVRLGKSGKVVRINTSGGNVSTLSMEPPMDDKPGRVPLLAEHKRAVVDPLSAFIMPMRGRTLGKEDCNRTIPVFDGGARLNIVMTYAETRQAEIGDYKGEAVVCNVRYVPVAGHRPARRVIKYMVDNRDISVWLAPIEGTSFAVPLRVSVKTIVGTAVLEAEKWSVNAKDGVK